MKENPFSRSQAFLEQSRSQFEGKESYECMRLRLQKRAAETAGMHNREVTRFLHLMREKGGGSIALV